MRARHDLEPGDAVTLDYGGRPLRDMLRNYGCVLPAAESPHEVLACKQLVTATHVRPRVARHLSSAIYVAICDDRKPHRISRIIFML